jgi:hypothetical protein
VWLLENVLERKEYAFLPILSIWNMWNKDVTVGAVAATSGDQENGSL